MDLGTGIPNNPGAWTDGVGTTIIGTTDVGTVGGGILKIRVWLSAW